MTSEEIKKELYYRIHLKLLWDNKRLEEWYISPNDMFKQMSPKDMVEGGFGKEVLTLVKNLLNE